jgi:hypothetical protein
MMSFKRSAQSLVIATVLLSAASAQAQQAPNKPGGGAGAGGSSIDDKRALAQVYFDQAREFMKVGNYEKACPLFAESQRLDPGGGTLLNLALCHEAQGKTASAWGEFKEAGQMAIHEGREGREKIARDHAAALEPQLVRLTVKMTDKAKTTQGMRITIDGTELGSAAWGMAVPIDPGAHEMVAEAPEKMSFRATINVAPKQRLTEVDVPDLVDAPKIVKIQHGGILGPATSTAGWVTVGVGVAAIGLGSYFGLKANALNQDAKKAGCLDTCPDRASKNSSDQAQVDANISTAVIGGGILVAAIGTYLIFDGRTRRGDEGPPPPRTARRFDVTPTISARGSGLTVAGEF